MTIILLHAGGQTAFESSAVLAYGSLENLIAGDLLAGVPMREKSLKDLWDAAEMYDGKEEDGDVDDGDGGGNWETGGKEAEDA